MHKLTALLPLAVSLAGPASAAAAPALELDRPCYAQFTTIGMTGSGFTPGGSVEITGTYPDGELAGRFELTASQAGTITSIDDTPEIQDARSALTISARDVASSQSATIDARLSSFGAYYRPWNTDGPARGRPGRVRQLEADGFIAGPRVLYAHYRLRGKVVKTLRLGRLTGPCGSLRVRFREFDFKGVRPGTYRVRFSQSRSWVSPYPYSDYKRVVVR